MYWPKEREKRKKGSYNPFRSEKKEPKIR